MTFPLLLLLVATSSALFAALGSDYADLRSYAGRWGVCAIAIASLIAAGIITGVVAKGAMCASVWVCE